MTQLTEWRRVLLVVCLTSRDLFTTAQSPTFSTSTTSATTTTVPSSASTVMVPPMIIQSPSSTIFNPASGSNSVQLLCGFTGTPTPTFKWYFNQQALNLNQTNIIQQSGGTISISPAGSADVGYYQCFANNQWGTAASNVAYVQMALIGSFPGQSAPTLVNAVQGFNATLSCNAPNSVPAGTFTWGQVTSMTSGSAQVQVSLSARVQIGLNGDLWFANVISADSLLGGAMYVCNIYNSVMATSKGGSYTSLSVSTSGAPSQVAPGYAFQSQSPTTALVGQSFTIWCFFTGLPTPVITWSVIGGSLPTGRYAFNSYNSSLTILNAQLSDSQTYQCVGQNTAGSKSFQIVVNVYQSPTFASTTGPVSVNATVGQTASFSCADNAVPPASIAWYQNGVALNPSSLPSQMNLTSGGTELLISDVCKENCPNGQTDLMVIQCNVSNAYGYTYGQGYLNVILPTTLQSGPGNQTVTAGGSVSFTCRFSSDPSTPVDIGWIFNGQLVYQSINSLSSTYTISNVQQSNEGIYFCFATNGYSNATAAGALFVTPLVVTTAADYCYFFLIVAIFIIIILLVIFLIFWHKYNVGESYPVDEVEKENGNDPVKDLQDAGFQDYQRPEGSKPVNPTTLGVLPPEVTLNNASINGDSFDSSNLGAERFYNDGGSPTGQYQYPPNIPTTFAPNQSAANTLSSNNRSRLQLAAPEPPAVRSIPTGAPLYRPTEFLDAEVDLDGQTSIAGTDLQIARRPNMIRLQTNPMYAGSMPVLRSPTGQEQLVLWDGSPPANLQQPRGIGGSVPTVLDTDLGPRRLVQSPGNGYRGNDAVRSPEGIAVAMRSPQGFGYDDSPARDDGFRGMPPLPPPRNGNWTDRPMSPPSRPMSPPTRWTNDEVYPEDVFDPTAAGAGFQGRLGPMSPLRLASESSV